MGCTYLLWDNFLDEDFLADHSVSSEQAAFPVENTFAGQRRSKVWRSNGYWEITAANKTLVFRETVGVDLTATLTEGEYTSSSALLSEIKTQMEAAGGSTYTVEVDTSTSRIKFTSNGVGGGGIFQLMWTSSTGLASTLGYNTAVDDTGALTYIADVLRINTSEWIKWDMGISTNPEAFVLVGLRNSPLKITPSATIRLEGNETDAWTTPSYSNTLTYNDRSIVVVDSDGIHTEGLRYWRIYIEDVDSAQGYVEIGQLFLGNFFSASRGAVQFPLQGQYVDNTATVFSRGGGSFSDIQPKAERFSLSWFGLTVAEKEDIDEMFDGVGTGKPFFVSLDPNAVFSSVSNYYTRYVKFSAEPQYQLVSPGVYSVTMELREEI